MHPLPLDRRDFLQSSAAGTLAVGIGSALPSGFLRAAESATSNEDRVVVVVQLSGGNDGLNTVVPYADDAYHAARPSLAISKSNVLTVDDEFGFHPSLRGMKDLLDQGQLAVIQGVGYENPNRSHFESMDIWHSCVRKDLPRTDGWLGRSLDCFATLKGGDVPAIHLGDKQQPFALASETIRVPTVKRLKEFQLRGSDTAALRKLLAGQSTIENPPSEDAGDLLGFLRSSTRNAIAASDRVTTAAEGYRTDVKYPASRLGEKLNLVAQLIDAGMKTRIYYLELDGFDTHAEQGETHAILLREWSDAVSAFVQDMNRHDYQDRVCVMTFSEFGRRVAENASSGTDHGAAAPMFLCGGGLNAGLIGEAPSLSDLQQGDLKHKIDFRQVYASVLKDWLRTDSDQILRQHYETLPIFS
jgi:uncharacterized protein (DUF1501 family)